MQNKHLELQRTIMAAKLDRYILTIDGQFNRPNRDIILRGTCHEMTAIEFFNEQVHEVSLLLYSDQIVLRFYINDELLNRFTFLRGEFVRALNFIRDVWGSKHQSNYSLELV